MKFELDSHPNLTVLTVITVLGIYSFGCFGLSITKPSRPSGIKHNYLVETSETEFTPESKVAFLITSYDFIKQQDQPYFLSGSHTPENVYLDYRHSKDDRAYDEAFGQRVQLFLAKECNISALDLKTNPDFLSYAKSRSPQLSEIVEWLGQNTDLDLLLVFHYSVGEKGTARASRISPIIIPTGNYVLYGASWDTKIEKYSAFTFQACAFDIHRTVRIMAYNLPGFVEPSAAVDAFITSQSKSSRAVPFHDVMLQILNGNE